MTTEEKVPAEAVHKEYSAEKMGTDDGICETKEVDLRSLAKETAGSVHKEYSTEKSHINYGSGETKATAQTEAVLRDDSAEETDTNDGSGEKRRLILWL